MAARTITYRFVVVFINEGREIPDAPEIWRGHVTYVSRSAPGGEADTRMGFTRLEELPRAIRTLLRASGVQCPPR